MALLMVCLVLPAPVYAKVILKNEFLIEDNGSDTFIIDAGDDITGDIILQFGASLAESLFWDNTENRFTLSDDIRVEGNQATIGQTYIADDHSLANSNGTISLGRNDSAWEIISFNNTNDQFEIFNFNSGKSRIGITFRY